MTDAEIKPNVLCMTISFVPVSPGQGAKLPCRASVRLILECSPADGTNVRTGHTDELAADHKCRIGLPRCQPPESNPVNSSAETVNFSPADGIRGVPTVAKLLETIHVSIAKRRL